MNTRQPQPQPQPQPTTSTIIERDLWLGSRKMVQITLKIFIDITPPEPPDYTIRGYSLGYPGYPAQAYITNLELVSIGRFNASQIDPQRQRKIIDLARPYLNVYDLEF
jgi:hypothetical protein